MHVHVMQTNKKSEASPSLFHTQQLRITLWPKLKILPTTMRATAFKASATSSGSDQPPAILRPWIISYDACPKIFLPFTNVDFCYTLFSAALLILVRYLSDAIFPSVLGWPRGALITKESAACAVSGLQASLFLPSLLMCLLSVPYRPCAKMSDSPIWWQSAARALIQFCSGYMVYDSIMLVVSTWDAENNRPGLSDGDFMFLGHHFATMMYMTTALVQGAGHQSAMILMLLGESTSPLMNANSILRFAVKVYTESTLVHTALVWSEFIYALMYVPMRTFGGPLAALHLTIDLFATKKGREDCNVFLSVLWMPMCWGVLIGSIPWIKEGVEMLSDGLVLKYHKDYDYGDAYEL